MTTKALVTIGIASIGRPGLLRALDSLEAMELPPGIAAEIVVADDDPAGGAAALLANREAGHLPVRVLQVGARNIAAARNACLEAASGPFMAFIDDDEWVARDWLVRMVAAKSEFQADVVIGPVHPIYPHGTPAWLARANPLHVDWGGRGRRTDTGRCGNVLFSRDDPRWKDLRFDPALGRSGGEDTDYFNRLHRAGASIVVTDDARIEEETPPSRLDPAYLKRRALRSGQSYARFRLAGNAERPGTLVFYAGAAAKALIGMTAGAVLQPIDRARALRFTLKGWLNLGKLRHMTGRALPELYAAPSSAPPPEPMMGHRGEGP